LKVSALIIKEIRICTGTFKKLEFLTEKNREGTENIIKDKGYRRCILSFDREIKLSNVKTSCKNQGEEFLGFFQ
jgi:hypothetical protein